MCALIPWGIIFVLTLGGIFLGALLRRVLPEDQLDEHVKDIVRLGVGLIATIASCNRLWHEKETGTRGRFEMFASFSLFSPLNVTVVTCSVCLLDGVRNEA